MSSSTSPSARAAAFPPATGAIALAELVSRLPNLRLRGMLSYDGGAQHLTGFATRRTTALANLEANVRVYEALKAKGLSTEIFSGGGTGTYNIQHEVPGFTDVQVGSYLFMDMQYLAIGNAAGGPVYDDFARSLTVLATVLNNRFPGRLTTDAGAKALTLNVPRRRCGRRTRHGLQRQLRRVRRHHVPGGASGRMRSATSWSWWCRTAIRS